MSDLDFRKISRGRSGQTFRKIGRENELHAATETDDDAPTRAIVSSRDGDRAFALRVRGPTACGGEAYQVDILADAPVQPSVTVSTRQSLGAAQGAGFARACVIACPSRAVGFLTGRQG